MDIGGDESAPAVTVEPEVTPPSGLNISDVIEAIQLADPTFAAVNAEPAMSRPPAAGGPSVRFVEQPASKALRFRYQCEGRSAGSIPGVRAITGNKTFPAIEICGYKGRAIVVVVCVTKDNYLVHPHNLVGRENCKDGVCTVTVDISPENSVLTFSNLGIQCVKRKDIDKSLEIRQANRIDPFKKGFQHRNNPQNIDLNAVRLCFQVFLDSGDGKFRHRLEPIVSDVIYDKKAMSDLVITKMSHASASVKGGQEVILLCEKVAKDDIGVTFTEMDGDRVVWTADSEHVFVHKQVAIQFTTPRYHNQDVDHKVKVLVQLKRPSDGSLSGPFFFDLVPLSEDPHFLEAKRKKNQNMYDYSRSQMPPVADLSRQTHHELMSIQDEHLPIKLEPRERASPHMSPPPAARFVVPAPAPAPPTFVAPAPVYTHDNTYWNHQKGPTEFATPMAPFNPEMAWGPSIPQTLPQTMIPNINPAAPGSSNPFLSVYGTSVSPNLAMGQMTPNMGQANMGHVSPNIGHMSPNMGHMSPNMGHMSPNMGHVSPNREVLSPHNGMVSPHIGSTNVGSVQSHVSAASPAGGQMEQMSQGMLPQHVPLPQPMEGSNSDPFSLTGLLDQDTELSDSLSKLSTGDLLPRDVN